MNDSTPDEYADLYGINSPLARQASQRPRTCASDRGKLAV